MKNQYREWISQRLKGLRGAMGVTQDKFSSIIQISQKRYAKYEEGFCEPSIYVLKKICKAHGLSVDDFLNGSPE